MDVSKRSDRDAEKEQARLEKWQDAVLAAVLSKGVFICTFLLLYFLGQAFPSLMLADAIWAICLSSALAGVAVGAWFYRSCRASANE